MDMGGHNGNLQYLIKRFPHAKVLRWTTHLNCMRKAAKQSQTRSFWLIASCCVYDDFDFLWAPVPWEQYQIHCWASKDQQLGDTFLVPTDKFLEQDPERIDLYQDVNWHADGVKRVDPEVVRYEDDDIIRASKTHINTPYAIVCKHWTHDYQEPQLWDNPCIINLNASKSASIVPRTATSYIDQQMYDYPHLASDIILPDTPLDVVFIENGEVNAEENFNHLQQLLQEKPNKLHRVTNVKGRVAAYQAAAKVSSTPWFFSVFAKLKIDENFDWSWQPDYWQGPKHYIFHARNPINGLEYGHMAMIAYNKNLVLSNTAEGLDFTLDQAHEVVPILSGVANYADDEFMAWRSAFREVIKLKRMADLSADIETEYRLKIWLTRGDGIKGEWSKQGALDGSYYYDEVRGDFDLLKLSYDWDWLNDRYNYLHGESHSR
jgi:hypothetical protein